MEDTPPVPNLQHCSFCGKRPDAKLSQVTWAWVNTDGRRRAWRQKLCVECFCTNLLVLDKPIASDGRLTCPGCGIDTEDDMDAVYCTAFIPSQGRVRYEMPTCAACAVTIRTRAQQGALLLPEQDSGLGSGAPDPTPSASDVWASLGLAPRG